jgi:hypothetical protein
VYGIEAINHYNGWAMAIAGALIVMSGLSVLSFIISQLHKVAALIESRGQKKHLQALPDAIPAAPPVQRSPLDIQDLTKDYLPLAGELGDSFELSRFYALARENNLPHVHLAIRSLRDAGMLVPLGGGVFKWK